MKKLGDFFNFKKDARILDVGTGNGNFIKMITSLTDDFKEIIGIDNLDKAIEASNKNFEDERIKFIKMDAFKMDFENDSFDIVCLSNSLHHLRDINGILKELARVLKPDGAILVNEMMNDGLTAKQKAHLQLHHFAAEIDRECGDTHNETFKAKEILGILERESELQIKDAWNLTYARPESNTAEEIEWLLKTIDRVMMKIEDKKRLQYYGKKADKIKKYIKKIGFDSATQLIVVLR